MNRWRFRAWLLVSTLLAATFLRPTWTLPRPIHRTLFVLDITQSMNARDYHVPGFPSDRLGYAKAALERAILALPCGNEAGLAVFTHKNTQLILSPLEICRHGAALRDALRAVDWRSAWAADSHIAFGLFDALRTARKIDAALVFLSDGEQIPGAVRQPQFSGKPGQIPGWIIGVGHPTPVPSPKLEMKGHMTGYWQTTDLPRQALTARYRQSTAPRRSGLLLSRLEEAGLRNLAAETGLGYRRLTTTEALEATLLQPETAHIRPLRIDLRPWLGMLALGIAIAVLI